MSDFTLHDLKDIQESVETAIQKLELVSESSRFGWRENCKDDVSRLNELLEKVKQIHKTQFESECQDIIRDVA